MKFIEHPYTNNCFWFQAASPPPSSAPHSNTSMAKYKLSHFLFPHTCPTNLMLQISSLISLIWTHRLIYSYLSYRNFEISWQFLYIVFQTFLNIHICCYFLQNQLCYFLHIRHLRKPPTDFILVLSRVCTQRHVHL